MSFQAHDGGSVPDTVRICPECGSPIPTAQPVAGVVTPASTSSTADATSALTEAATTATQVSQEEAGVDGAAEDREKETGVQDVAAGVAVSPKDEEAVGEVGPSADRVDSCGAVPHEPDDPMSTDKGANEGSREGQGDEGPPLSGTATQEGRFGATRDVTSSQPQEGGYEAQSSPPPQEPHSQPQGQSAQEGPDATYAQQQGQAYGQPQTSDSQAYSQQQASDSQAYSQQQTSDSQAYSQQQTSYTQVQVFTQQPYPTRPVSPKSKVAAGLLAIFCGVLGFHKFYLGYTSAGIIMFLLTFFLWWTIVVPFAMILVGIIEGVIYLTRSDEEFQRIYVQSQRDWF